MKLPLDNYALKARTFPVLIVILPAFVLSGYYVTGFEWYIRIPAGVLVFSLVAYLLAQIGRDRGKRKEPDLYNAWGGKPTTQLLRHCNTHLDANTKARYKKRLGEHLIDLDFPSAESESEDPVAADAVYESCTRHAIAVTRDAEKYSLLLKENTSYGFRRNLWAMKTWALVILVACLLIHIYLATHRFTSLALEPQDIALGALLLVDFLFWTVLVLQSWVKTPAFAYAERLFETVEKPRND